MGTCCEAHLTTMVRNYVPNAENGAVTVRILENPPKGADPASCVYCKAPEVFQVSYYAKKTDVEFVGTEG